MLSIVNSGPACRNISGRDIGTLGRLIREVKTMTNVRLPLLLLWCVAWSSLLEAGADTVSQGKDPFMIEPATGRAYFVGRGSHVPVYRRSAHPRMHVIKIQVSKPSPARKPQS